ncbi:MAG: Na+:solute symporter [Saprospiraceae bacterium]|jgi:solute:Na+ symporter, SSS family|nr:Na+:solute symporter [Saprospiraceae bacterium]MDP4999418.1 Na+:solute symporter [Saprospiraceae bacterium]
MNLSTLDWSIIIGFFILSLAIGLIVARQSGKSFSEFFLSGRGMPWWLLGISMVATTFSADTPNLVTDIVRKNGIAGNWAWWAFLLTGMLTVFVYAKLWRRSGVLTDLEFYEIRYSGKAAAILRGFRAIYLGFFFNIMIMATVTLAAIKIGGVMLGFSPFKTVFLASVITVLYTSLGGLRGVILTDFFQFILAMVGLIWAAVVVVNLPEVGGLDKLLAHENVQGKLNFLPDFNDPAMLVPLFIIPIAVQWWSVWYPGAEPGGGGYIAQRILAAKNEKHAIAATLLFNLAHYALRPWPWILIALASLVVFPDLQSLQAAFPQIDAQVINDDLAFPAMLTYLPSGLLGIVVASLIAAYMSTISTQLNWGSSYLVNDFYRRFIKPDASDKQLVGIGRLATVLIMICSGVLALYLQNALQAFNILLQIGAGTGLLFILRWFWWRINAYSELAAMGVSFVVALYFELVYTGDMPDHLRLLTGVGITTAGWVLVTFLTPASKQSTLISFYRLIKPHAAGWQPVIRQAVAEKQLDAGHQPVTGKLPLEIMSMVAGCFAVYGALFATGFFLYGQTGPGWIATGTSALAAFIIFRNWKQVL